MPDQWKQGVGGLVRRYRRRIAGGIPWSEDQVADGMREGIADIDDMTAFNAEFPSVHGSLSDLSENDPENYDEQDADYVDLFAIRADDELLDALGGAASNGKLGPHRHFGDSDLESLLAAWRSEADVEPIPMLYDTDAAVHVIERSVQERRRPQRRWLVPVASAAAVLVIAFTSLGVAARDAQPGDPLWGLTQVLYADHAKSILAAVTVRTELSHASVALQEGHFTEARTALSQAQAALPAVDTSDGKADLTARGQQLAAQLNSAAPNGSAPPSTFTVNPPSSAPSTTPSPSSTPQLPTQTTPTTPVLVTPPPDTTPDVPTSPPTTGSQSDAGPGTISTSPQTESHSTAAAGAETGSSS